MLKLAHAGRDIVGKSEDPQRGLNHATHSIFHRILWLPMITFYLCCHGIYHHDKYLSASVYRMTFHVYYSNASRPGIAVASSSFL